MNFKIVVRRKLKYESVMVSKILCQTAYYSSLLMDNINSRPGKGLVYGGEGVVPRGIEKAFNCFIVLQ